MLLTYPETDMDGDSVRESESEAEKLSESETGSESTDGGKEDSPGSSGDEEQVHLMAHGQEWNPEDVLIDEYTRVRRSFLPR